MQNIFSNFLCFSFFFSFFFHHPNVTLNKFKLQRRKRTKKKNKQKKNNTSDIRYHETTVTIRQIGTRDKQKTRKVSVTKTSHPLKAMQKLQTCSFFVLSV